MKVYARNPLNVGFFRLMCDEESLTTSLCSFFLSKFVPSMTFNMYWLHHSINLLKIMPFLGGWLSDRLLGDPEGWPHPIVWFGKAISAGEKELNKGSERVLKGGILAVVLILGVYLICERILSWAWIIHPQFSGLLTAVGVFYAEAGRSVIMKWRRC